MKRLIIILGSSALALCTCLALVRLSQRLGMSVEFPAPRGEEDFSARAAYFFFGVCPAFLVLGGWIGYASRGMFRIWLSMWAGVLGGSSLVFITLQGIREQLEILSEGSQATDAVALFFAVWVGASFGGTLLVRRLFQCK